MARLQGLYHRFERGAVEGDKLRVCAYLSEPGEEPVVDGAHDAQAVGESPVQIQEQGLLVGHAFSSSQGRFRQT